MRTTLGHVALATGAALQSSRGAEGSGRPIQSSLRGARRTRASERSRELPARLEEEIRLVGALAEHFAAAAAERLMDADAMKEATRPTLPLIALAAGEALCAPLLTQRAMPRLAKGKGGQRPAGVRLPRRLHGQARGARAGAS